MTDSLSDDAAKVLRAPSYRSDQLAALLEVFSVWSSGSFMRGLAAGAGLDLDATSIVAITLLAREGNQRASALATRLRVGASAISKLSNRLSAIELVEKLPDPDDTRATLLRLTPAGTAAARALVQAGDSMMAELMREWPEDDRIQFNRLLRRFRDDAIVHSVRTETAVHPYTEPRKL
ncbi:MarR family winged helix-turn-helix transcriptional regulator [Cryobacterium sp. PAMC25264]|uniref:MarR family winged helix-turn-helix transcriptional regulator n=1 Tax=Cryobacterium sp. PAMC25264 TaxID=2861288 RepID=UPI001C629570|nr:MarR family transcriptional regulator [Cryobacterium sp. PAMC25264]QYF75201.1 MarR family transcriptional regulator [Cryobacterium sp. PAMC25264]